MANNKRFENTIFLLDIDLSNKDFLLSSIRY